MAHILLADAQTWLESTKANLTQLDANLETQISNNVLGRLASTYDDPTFGVPTWTDNTHTPNMVKQIIAMFYAGWFYDRQYSEMVAAEGPSYGTVLRNYAETLIEGLNAGTITLVDLEPNEPAVAPVFYPTDVSSTERARWENKNPDDTSFGPAKFSMGRVF